MFVTGKGGVGKTTVAAGLAQLAAEHGKRVLVCEVDAKGDVTSLFEAPPDRLHAAGDRARRLVDVDGHRGVAARVPQAAPAHPGGRPDRSAGQGLRLRRHGRAGRAGDPDRRQVLLGGAERHYDLVVVDAPASGHIIGQLAAPQAINDLVKVGLIRSQTDWMLDILSDPRQTGLVAVCTPEEMPVSETLELEQRVREETTVRMSAVVVNRVLPELFGQREEEIFEQLRTPEAEERALGAGRRVRWRPVLEAARLAVTMRRTRSAHLQRLQAGLPEGLPVLLLPYLFVAQLRRPHHAAGGPRARRGAGPVTAADAPTAKTVGPAARGQGHRHRLRAGRRGQDDHGGRVGRHGGRRAGRPGPGAHRRPGAPPGRRARV